MKYYVGITNNYNYELFMSGETPTREKFSYLAVIGPFRTKRGALFMAQFGKGNPHLQCVADAERISKQ